MAGRTRRLPVAIALGAAWLGYAATLWADGPAPGASSANAPPILTTDDLSTRSDAELTALTARWGDLSPSERRRLLAEVRGRMAQNQARRDRAGPPRVAGGVVLQRRYGRKADGSVVVETRVLELAPQMAPRAAQAPEAAAAQRDPGGARVTFGIGFEQRVRRTRQPPADRVLETDLTASHPQTEGQLDRSQSAP